MPVYFYKNLAYLLSSKTPVINGISPARIKSLLQGKTPVTPEELCLFSDFFQLPIDQMLRNDLTRLSTKRKKIKFLVSDVDGVLTDGGMYYSEKGDEFKKFHTRDGMAIKNLTAKGFPVGFLSSGFNKKLIERRAKLLGVKFVYVGTEPKLKILSAWCKSLKLKLDEVAFIGDDINDVEVMKKVGLRACPADAHPHIKAIVDVITEKKGGEACLREFTDRFL